MREPISFHGTSGSINLLRRWQNDRFASPSKSAFNMTLSGSLPGIIFPSFFSSVECTSMVNAVVRDGLQAYQHVEANVAKFGLVQMEYNTPEKKQDYFNKVEAANMRYAQVLGGLPNPIAAVMEYIGRLTGSECTIASESNLGPYFGGTFRHVKGPGLTHFDFGPVETEGWAISNIRSQLSWNVYLSDPEEGGELLVYENQWSTQSERFKSCSYWYHNDALVGGRHVTYRPQVGDLVIFNSLNFHEIKAPKCDRFTVSSFIGLTSDNQLIFWS